MKLLNLTAFTSITIATAIAPAFAKDCAPVDGLPLSGYRVDTMGENQHHVHTEVLINATASEVWGVLSDFKNMPSWSTTFQGMVGDIRDGGQVTVTYKFPDRVAEIPHTISYNEGVGYGWSDPLGFAPKMADNHVFEIEPVSECLTRFKQYDTFTGVGPEGSEITTAFISQDAMGVYRIFNAELKVAVEAKFQ
ncbi:SRPBCC family protein [Marinomonas transparens]|uniref:SRPBCC family protein n=1 Tax=Marinomonas transparens TaxID=2795388 RepID=A0A934JX19_9GAMM|nr:SRPBCC family protein [Marinomonas transparens]MBJ7538542.1 SRPBCC family protein [Marinomonas transparens]